MSEERLEQEEKDDVEAHSGHGPTANDDPDVELHSGTGPVLKANDEDDSDDVEAHRRRTL
jgi:hypothetical protein